MTHRKGFFKDLAQFALKTYPEVAGKPVIRFTFDNDTAYAHVETTRSGHVKTDRLVFMNLDEMVRLWELEAPYG